MFSNSMIINLCSLWSRFNSARSCTVGIFCCGAGGVFGDAWSPQTTPAQGSPSQTLKVKTEAYSE